jgi:SOS-response transcriptional repressor LexA
MQIKSLTELLNILFLVFSIGGEMKKISFGQRLKSFRKALGINITQMSDTLGMVKSNISRYERDLNKPTVQFLELLLKHYRINLNWLFGEETEMFLVDKQEIKLSEMSHNEVKKLNIPKEKVYDFPQVQYTSFGVPVFNGELEDNAEHLLPVYGEISAGEPLEIKDQEPYNFVPFPINKPNMNMDDYLVFKVNGLSMYPEIMHQDIVFIKKNNNWFELNGKIVAVNIQGEMTLKRLMFTEETREIIFKSLNRSFADIKVDFQQMDSTYLVGELIAIRRIPAK